MDWKTFFKVQDREVILKHRIGDDIFWFELPYWSRSRRNQEQKLLELAEQVLHYKTLKAIRFCAKVKPTLLQSRKFEKLRDLLTSTVTKKKYSTSDRRLCTFDDGNHVCVFDVSVHKGIVDLS
eukprot:TRINITY_DN7217_c0_g2_i1.p1 TRINITY_DN7217_c0_g2~~TRINITY_DN7217_c0_g2_i1.p1  ORF type:complete len:136 (-),score=21.22 TRINITY_DN7217_c0_g2_i1:90-458(-)